MPLQSVATLYGYDKLGRLISVTDALNQVTSYTYDEVGNKLTQTDAQGRTTTWEYDALGRAISRTLPLGQQETMAYNEVGNMTSRIDFNGSSSIYSYDVMNRVINIDYDDGSSELFTYDDNGNRTQATQISLLGDVRITNYSFDNRDRLIQEVQANGAVLDYEYDAQSNRTKVAKTVDGETTDTVYVYDSLNRLQTVTENNRTTTYGYDAIGNRASVSYPNGTSEVYTYNSLNRLTQKQTYNGQGALVQSYTYTLYPTGRRTQINELAGRLTVYTYDDLYRLTSEATTDAVNGNYLASYQYDMVGNRTYETVDGVQTSYVYNNNDWLIQTGGTVYTYDNNGNTLATVLDGVTTTYTYSTKNHVTSVTKTGELTAYRYNIDGIRTAQIDNQANIDYIVDSNRDYAQVLIELEDNTPVVTYTYGDDLVSQVREGQAYYYHYDGLGSTRALSNTAGAITDSYNYEAFGEVLNQTGDTENSYLFTGEQFDANLNQYYLRARYYDQGVGRFTSMDTFQGWLTSPITLNKYVYANSNPAMFIDPSGNISMNGLMSAINVRATLSTAAQPTFSIAIKKVGKRVACLAIEEVVTSTVMELAGGVYILQDGNSQYVGRTNDFERRYKEHVRDVTKRITKTLARFHISGSRNELRLIEQFFIELLEKTKQGITNKSNSISRKPSSVNSKELRKLINKLDLCK